MTLSIASFAGRITVAVNQSVALGCITSACVVLDMGFLRGCRSVRTPPIHRLRIDPSHRLGDALGASVLVDCSLASQREPVVVDDDEPTRRELGIEVLETAPRGLVQIAVEAHDGD